MGGQQTQGPMMPGPTPTPDPNVPSWATPQDMEQARRVQKMLQMQNMLGGTGGPPKPSDVNSRDAAVAEAQRRYPRIKDIPMAMTLNPQRAKNSETYAPEDSDNPVPGKWTVDFGREPYGSHPASWPETIALESLHALQHDDPNYVTMTERIVESMTPQQLKQARDLYNRQQKEYGISEQFPATDPHDEAFQKYLRMVHVQEMVRGPLWGNFFQQYEGGSGGDEWNLTPKQQQIIGQIHNYLTTSDSGTTNGGR
jgi:hypothetical protein